MQDQSCIFCKIIKREIPSKIIAETPLIIVIEDLHPKAPTHVLIMPKKHIATMKDIGPEDSEIMCALFETVRNLSKKLDAPKAFNIFCNNGAEAGQSIFHLHWHFLAGKNPYSGDFKL